MLGEPINTHVFLGSNSEEYSQKAVCGNSSNEKKTGIPLTWGGILSEALSFSVSSVRFHGFRDNGISRSLLVTPSFLSSHDFNPAYRNKNSPFLCSFSISRGVSDKSAVVLDGRNLMPITVSGKANHYSTKMFDPCRPNLDTEPKLFLD